jgi:8-oxo-dGTP pyrophosphatase MutT (NUDIX family)
MTISIRTDIVDVYVFRRPPGEIEFLQLHRAPDRRSLPGTWQPIMGHTEPGETALATALRELQEEISLVPGTDLLGLFALQSIHPFFIATTNEIHLSPRFAAEVALSWQPRLNDEHTNHRWIRPEDLDTHMMWPGQRAACREILSELINEQSPSRERLRIRL